MTPRPSYADKVQSTFLRYLDAVRNTASTAPDASRASNALLISEAMQALWGAIGDEAFLRFQKGPLKDGVQFYLLYYTNFFGTAPRVYRINDGWVLVYHPDRAGMEECSFQFDPNYDGPHPTADEMDDILSILELVH